MTPTERAVDWCRRTHDETPSRAELHRAIGCCPRCSGVSLAIEAAVAAERERCAGIARSHGVAAAGMPEVLGEEIAARIAAEIEEG